ncbi:MAG: DUF4282 domain-containing protein [Nocardioidaceae bacterium]
MTTTYQTEVKGFFRSLVDFNFTSFITLKFLKVYYAIAFGLIMLLGLIFFVAFLARGGAFVVLAIIGVPLLTLFYLILTRMGLEMTALFFRIGENSSLMARALAGGQSGGPAGGQANGPAGDPVYPGQGTGPTSDAAPVSGPTH